jgi:hypothetical protein
MVRPCQLLYACKARGWPQVGKTIGISRLAAAVRKAQNVIDGAG